MSISYNEFANADLHSGTIVKADHFINLELEKNLHETIAFEVTAKEMVSAIWSHSVVKV